MEQALQLAERVVGHPFAIRQKLAQPGDTTGPGLLTRHC
jgi:hypothetical protein